MSDALSAPVPSPADDPETDAADRFAQLEPEGGATVEQVQGGDGAFAGPDDAMRAEDERLAEDGRDTGE